MNLRWAINRGDRTYVGSAAGDKPREANIVIDIAPAKAQHKCGGVIFRPVGVPVFLDSWGVCWKCLAEVRA